MKYEIWMTLQTNMGKDKTAYVKTIIEHNLLERFIKWLREFPDPDANFLSYELESVNHRLFDIMNRKIKGSS